MNTATWDYHHDFAAWALHQASLLKAGKVREIDLINLAEEMESMGKSQHRELESRMKQLIAHLLKWQFQETYRSASWRSTIAHQRSEIPSALKDSPSLRNHLSDDAWVQNVWQQAVRLAASETGLPKKSFPEYPIWSVAQILDEEFLPNQPQG